MLYLLNFHTKQEQLWIDRVARQTKRIKYSCNKNGDDHKQKQRTHDGSINFWSVADQGCQLLDAGTEQLQLYKGTQAGRCTWQQWVKS